MFGTDGTKIKGKPAPDVYLRAMAKLEGKAMDDLADADKACYIAVEDGVSGPPPWLRRPRNKRKA
jgi:beta-phosphoglucomutase-like phosphatase (HAD superfamily)